MNETDLVSKWQEKKGEEDITAYDLTTLGYWAISNFRIDKKKEFLKHFTTLTDEEIEKTNLSKRRIKE